jgi:hypothetical protein
MPTSHNHHLRRPRLEARQIVVDVPIPGLIPDPLAVGVLARPHRVVDQPQISPSTRHGAADADSEVFPAPVRVPSRRSTAVLRDTDAEHHMVLRARIQVPRPSTEPLDQILRVARRDDALRRIAAEIPRRKHDARIRTLRAAGRHQHHQPVALAAFHRLQFSDQRPMMRRRLKPQLQPLDVRRHPAKRRVQRARYLKPFPYTQLGEPRRSLFGRPGQQVGQHSPIASGLKGLRLGW